MSSVAIARCDSSLSTRSSPPGSLSSSSLSLGSSLYPSLSRASHVAVSTHSVIVRTRTFRRRTQYLVQLWPAQPGSSSPGNLPIALLPDGPACTDRMTDWQRSLTERRAAVLAPDVPRRPCGAAIYSPTQPGQRVAEQSLRRIIRSSTTATEAAASPSPTAASSSSTPAKSLKRRRNDDSRSSSPDRSTDHRDRRPAKHRPARPAQDGAAAGSPSAAGVFTVPATGSRRSLATLRDGYLAAAAEAKQSALESRLRRFLGI